MPHYIGRITSKGSTKASDSNPCEAGSLDEARKTLAHSLPGYMKIMWACGFITMQVIEVGADYNADDDDDDEEEPQPVPDDDEEEGGAFPA